MKKLSSANGNLAMLTDRIRLARQSAGLSQAELAEHSGVTPSAVAQWESPHGTQPDLDHLIRIGATTKVTLDWLATGHGAHRSARKVRTNVESSAVVVEAFAQTLLEEAVLSCMRLMKPRARELFVALVQELTKGRSALRPKPR